MVGAKQPQRSRAEFENMRRRLEGEGTATQGVASGVEGAGEGQAERRRTMGQQIVDQFREAL